MNVWWCAINKKFVSYQELKDLHVVSQGWRKLGDLSTLLPLYPEHKDRFEQIIQILGDIVYADDRLWVRKDRNPSRAARVLWSLFSMKAGDLVIGLEGTNVRGICELKIDAISSYRHMPESHYAQTVGCHVTWIDWNYDIWGEAPTPPRRSVHGIRKVHNERDRIINLWLMYKEQQK